MEARRPPGLLRSARRDDRRRQAGRSRRLADAGHCRAARRGGVRRGVGDDAGPPRGGLGDLVDRSLLGVRRSLRPAGAPSAAGRPVAEPRVAAARHRHRRRAGAAGDCVRPCQRAGERTGHVVPRRGPRRAEPGRGAPCEVGRRSRSTGAVAASGTVAGGAGGDRGASQAGRRRRAAPARRGAARGGDVRDPVRPRPLPVAGRGRRARRGRWCAPRRQHHGRCAAPPTRTAGRRAAPLLRLRGADRDHRPGVRRRGRGSLRPRCGPAALRRGSADRSDRVGHAADPRPPATGGRDRALRRPAQPVRRGPPPRRPAVPLDHPRRRAGRHRPDHDVGPAGAMGCRGGRRAMGRARRPACGSHADGPQHDAVRRPPDDDVDRLSARASPDR